MAEIVVVGTALTSLTLRPGPAFSADCCSQQAGLLHSPAGFRKGLFITGPSLEGRAEAEESSGLAAFVQGVGNQGLAHFRG